MLLFDFFLIVVSHRFVEDLGRAIYSDCFMVSCRPAAFSLDGSGLSFADLFRLVAFCCISRWGRCNTGHMRTQIIIIFFFYDQPPPSYEVTYVGVSTFDLDPKSGSDKSDVEGRKSWRLMMMTSPQCSVCTRMCSCVKSLTCTVVLSGCCGWKKSIHTSELKIKKW